MLKASSRLLAQITLASDLALIAGCWLVAYYLRFYLVGPFPLTLGIPPLDGYLFQLLPILAVGPPPSGCSGCTARAGWGRTSPNGWTWGKPPRSASSC